MNRVLTIGALIIFGAFPVLVCKTRPAPEPKRVEKQPPLVCGNEHTGAHYMSSYLADEGFIVDLVSGGIWPDSECTPFPEQP